MAKNIQIESQSGHKLAGFLSEPGKDAAQEHADLLILLVHGFPGHQDAHEGVFKDLQLQLARKGYKSFCFDFSGCGDSAGHEEDFSLETAAQDLRSVLSWAREQDNSRFIVIAEGLGAAFSLLNIGQEALCYVLLWPMLDLPRITYTALGLKEGDNEWKTAAYIDFEGHRVGSELLQQLQDTDLGPALKGLERPILVMHGAKDQQSPIDQLELIRANAGHRRVEITSFQDGTHGLPQENHRKSMRYHILQFIEKYT